jgi:hypothetical protein
MKKAGQETTHPGERTAQAADIETSFAFNTAENTSR